MPNPERIENAVNILRTFVPKDLSGLEFQSVDIFFKEMDRFKFPMIAYLADKAEEAITTAPEKINDDFLDGYVDGVISMLRLIADLQLVTNTGGR